MCPTLAPMPLNRRAWLVAALAAAALPRAMAAAELSLNFRGTPNLHRRSARGYCGPPQTQPEKDGREDTARHTRGARGPRLYFAI